MVRIAVFVFALERTARLPRDVLNMHAVFFEGELTKGHAFELLAVPSKTVSMSIDTEIVWSE